MKKFHSATTTAKQTKKAYHRPITCRYGKISEITTGGSGTLGDQGTATGKRPRVLRK